MANPAVGASVLKETGDPPLRPQAFMMRALSHYDLRIFIIIKQSGTSSIFGMEKPDGPRTGMKRRGKRGLREKKEPFQGILGGKIASHPS
jgi:hypothetical protein